MKQALAACQQLNKNFGNYASGWYTASQLAMKLRNFKAALQTIEQALRLEPNNPRWQLQKASALMSAGNTEAARPLILALDKQPQTSAYACAQLGLQLSRLELHERSLKQYLRATELEPGVGEHHYNCATVYRFLGEMEAAAAALEKAIALNPRDFDAYKLRSDLRTQTPEHNNVSSLKAALEHYGSEPTASITLHYALAKELEDLQQWSESFTHLSTGASNRRKRMRYTVAGDLDTMAGIIEAYPTDCFNTPANADGCQNNEAIFILGMPRTGSTLAERILASHSQIQSAGELNNFALVMSQAVRKLAVEANISPKQISKQDRVELSTQLDFAQLGQQYIDSTRPLSGSTAHFIDKMPLNFLYAGLIHKALPQAKIIHLERHPLDTCYAIYKTLFADAYPFSYQLEELGQYYVAYRKLMDHWHSVMPGVIYNQSYESLVSQQELQSRALVDYCQLTWEPECLDFHKQKAASTTASASQVRQAIYQSSVGKWQHYAQQLTPLIRVLEAEGVDPLIH